MNSINLGLGIMSFIEGLLSFFSPCVLPLLPVYLSFLSGGNVERSEEGKLKYRRGTVLINTLFFILGISVTFFILALGVKGLGSLISSKEALITRIGGGVVIAFGLYQLIFYGTKYGAKREKRINVDTSRAKGPLLSFLLGFSFSFSWTPCIGPTLSSVIVMASTTLKGDLYIFLYSLGFTLPFLLLGFFTSSLLSLLQRFRNAVKYTVRIGAVIMIALGVIMITSTFDKVEIGEEEIISEENEYSFSEDNTDSYILSKETEDIRERVLDSDSYILPQETEEKREEVVIEEERTETPKEKEIEEIRQESRETEEHVETATKEKESVEEKSDIDNLSYSFLDQYGKIHRLSSYKGKVVFLNAWATWCGPCRSEMGDIEALYSEYKNSEEVVIISAAFPFQSGEGSGADVKAFMKNMGYTYPVLLDNGGKLLSSLYISAFPTTVVFDKKGNIFSYVPGAMDKERMERLIINALGSEN